jgi:hypothetical protein
MSKPRANTSETSDTRLYGTTTQKTAIFKGDIPVGVLYSGG